MAITMYQNMKDFRVVMPKNYINQGEGGGSGGLQSNLDVISAFAALGAMDKMKGTERSGVIGQE